MPKPILQLVLFILLYHVSPDLYAQKPAQENDPLFPKTDPLIKKLNLTKAEKADLIAFLESITAVPTKVQQPALPGR